MMGGSAMLDTFQPSRQYGEPPTLNMEHSPTPPQRPRSKQVAKPPPTITMFAAAGSAEDPTHNWSTATPEVIVWGSGSALPQAKGFPEVHLRGVRLHVIADRMCGCSGQMGLLGVFCSPGVLQVLTVVSGVASVASGSSDKPANDRSVRQ